MNHRFETVIVGMGPAGLAAAAELCRLNVHVAVIDDNPGLGGQVYRRLSSDFSVSDTRFLGVKYKKGQQLIEEVNAVRDRGVWFNNAYIWGCFDAHTLSLVTGKEISLIEYDKLLLAEGAMERPLPFPGWTLPGIMTLGGLQKCVLHDRTLPGRRFLLAGSSPLLAPVAASIIKAGGEIAAICDAVPSSRYLELAPEILKRKELALETFHYLFPVILERVRILKPYTIISAAGHSRVEEVRTAQIGDKGLPVKGSEKRFQIDTLGVSNGFLPAGRLARLCGCEHEYDPEQCYWKPKTNDCLRSSLPDIYIAGDSKGIGGRDLAEVEGRLAALQIAGELGRVSFSEIKRQTEALRGKRLRLRRYASKLNKILAPGAQSLDVMDKDTIVCRCERITVGDVLDGIRMGYRNINEMKRTRIGMGLCQGRTCESIVARIMIREGIPVEETGYLNLRPPLSPIPFSSFEQYARENPQSN